ncbi:Na-Ca exchanger/integrin-beta4 [Phytophthora cactorum]|nr:Na-Ca exchanger/integrin-beta4 [Phytophthora cactorum]
MAARVGLLVCGYHCSRRDIRQSERGAGYCNKWSISVLTSRLLTTEDFGVASITIQRGLGSDGRAAVYVSTIPGVGSAVAGRDFKPLYNVSLVWQDGEDFEKALYVPVYNDGKPQESPKTLLLKLHDAIGAEINPDRNQTQLCCRAWQLQFSNATVNNVAEDSTLTIPVLWVAGTTSTASVIFEIVCKSACFPADFVLVSPTTQLLGWKRDDYPATATTRMQSIVLKVLNDELYEQAESFSIRLVSVEPTQDSTIGTGTIGDIGEIVVTIDGPNDARSGTLQFDAGLDYEPLERELSWKEGDTSDRQIVVRSLTRADPRLPSRRLALVLRNNKGAPINGAHASTSYVDITSVTNVYLGDINFATREPLESVLRAPDLSFIELASRSTSSKLQLCPSVIVTEPGVLSVAIQRNFAAFPVPVRVTVKTVTGTATPGVDYEPLTNVVTWKNGEIEVKQVLVKILDPPSYDHHPRSFWLQLSDATGAIVVQASTLDVTKLLLQSERVLKNGQTFKLTAQQTTTNSGDGTTIVLNIGAGDLNSLKRIVGLAKIRARQLPEHRGSCLLSRYDCETSRSAALAVTTFTADTLPPTLLGYSLDLPRRLLKLHFSEAVDFTTLKIEALTFAEAAAGIDVYRLSSATTRLFSPQPDPLSGATLRDANRLPADNTFLTLQLGRTDVTALSSFGAGRIGITRANTFLGMGSAFVADFAGNSVKAVGPPGKMLQISTADCSTCPPGSYLTSSCSDLKDRKCATCSVCPRNSFALEACRATQDTLCYRELMGHMSHVPSVVQVNMLQCPVLQRLIVCVHRDSMLTRRV